MTDKEPAEETEPLVEMGDTPKLLGFLADLGDEQVWIPGDNLEELGEKAAELHASIAARQRALAEKGRVLGRTFILDVSNYWIICCLIIGQIIAPLLVCLFFWPDELMVLVSVTLFWGAGLVMAAMATRICLREECLVVQRLFLPAEEFHWDKLEIETGLWEDAWQLIRLSQPGRSVKFLAAGVETQGAGLPELLATIATRARALEKYNTVLLPRGMPGTVVEDSEPVPVGPLTWVLPVSSTVYVVTVIALGFIMGCG